MARKYIRGNPNKNYYDNTKFIGTLATNDPVPEGMFRHLVNFDVSDTGQSITPRRGYLTTSIRSNNEDIVLSNQTIIFKDPEKGKHIIYDYKSKKAFVLNINHSNIQDNRLIVEKEIGVDHIEVYEPFLKEFENIQLKNAELLDGVGETYTLRISDSNAYNNTEYESNILVNKNEKYLTSSDLNNLHTVIPALMAGRVNFWDDDNNRPRVYVIKLPVVLNETLVGDTYYRVDYFLKFALSQTVFNSEHIYESASYVTPPPVPDMTTTLSYSLNSSPTTSEYTTQIENLVRQHYRNSVENHSDVSKTQVTHEIINVGDPIFIEIKTYKDKYRFHYTHTTVTSVINGDMFEGVTVVDYDELCVTNGDGKYIGTQLHPVKAYTENYVIHKGEFAYAYKDVATPVMLCFDTINSNNAANKILNRLAYTDHKRIPRPGVSKIFTVVTYNKDNTVTDGDFKLSPIVSKENYKVEWSKNSITRETLSMHHINKPDGDAYSTPVPEEVMNTGEVRPTVIEYDNKPTIFIDTRKYGFLNPNNLEKSLENLLTQERIFDELKNKPEFIEALKYQSNPATVYLEAVAKYVISGGGYTYHRISGFIVKVTITFTAVSTTTNGVPMYETRPSVHKSVIYARQLNLQHTDIELRGMYETYEKYKRIGTTSTYIENLNNLGKAYSYVEEIPGVYYTPYTHKEETDEFKTEVIEPFIDNIGYTSSTTKLFIDSYGISRVLNKATFRDGDKKFPVILTYKYTGKKLLVGAINMHGHASIFRPNLASKNTVIPNVMQKVYDSIERPYGHTDYAPYVFIVDGEKYHTNYINPSVNYKFIPHFLLNPPEYTADVEAAAMAWAVRIEVRTKTSTIYSKWCDLITRAPIISDGEDLIKYDGGLIYTDIETIKSKGINTSQITVSFFFMPYDKGVLNYDNDDAIAWNLQAIKETTGVAISTYDSQLLKSIIPTEIPDDVKYIRNTSTYTVYEDNRLVMWFENSVWISDPGVGYFAEENKHTFNERVVKVLPFRDTLLVFTVENLYVIYPSEIEQQTGTRVVGEGESAREEPIITKVKIYIKQAVLYNILVSDKYKNVIQVFNQNILFYSEEGQLYLIRPSAQIDSDTRYTLQMFNKNVNDILLNYDKYINERLEQYFVDKRITKDSVKIDAQVSVNDVKIFFCVPGVITYILKYNVLTNQFTVYDTLTFSNINSVHFIEGGEMYITETNERRYITLPYTAMFEDDNNVDMTHYDNYKREPINALLDTGNINLNNHINKRYRDMHVVFKNLDTHKLLFNSETVIDDVISHPFKNLYVEVQELNGNKIIAPVEDLNTFDLAELTYFGKRVFKEEGEANMRDLVDVTHAATGSFGLLFDFKEFLSNRLITYKTSILGTGKVFRLRMQFISKGRYKIQEFGIIYKERSV